MGRSHDFPFGIMDVVELLHIRVRRAYGDGCYYTDCPICGDRRGKMSVNTRMDAWRCNYCGEHGGMLSLYARVCNVSKAEAYREIWEALQGSDFSSTPPTMAPAPQGQEPVEQSQMADAQTVHQTFSMMLDMLILTKAHREHLRIWMPRP